MDSEHSNVKNQALLENIVYLFAIDLSG